MDPADGNSPSDNLASVLRGAFESTSLIAVACGILMDTQHLDVPAATKLLREIADRYDLTLPEAAQLILDAYS